jgi:hypothetical protein
MDVGGGGRDLQQILAFCWAMDVYRVRRIAPQLAEISLQLTPKDPEFRHQICTVGVIGPIMPTAKEQSKESEYAGQFHVTK